MTALYISFFVFLFLFFPAHVASRRGGGNKDLPEYNGGVTEEMKRSPESGGHMRTHAREERKVSSKKRTPRVACRRRRRSSLGVAYGRCEGSSPSPPCSRVYRKCGYTSEPPMHSCRRCDENFAYQCVRANTNKNTPETLISFFGP